MTTKKDTPSKLRLLTVGYQYYESRHKNPELQFRPRQIPCLRLSSDWLHAAGFSVGQKARVQVTKQGILIVAAE